MFKALRTIAMIALLLPVCVVAAGCDNGPQPANPTEVATSSAAIENLQATATTIVAVDTQGPTAGPTLTSAAPPSMPTVLATPTGTIIDQSSAKVPSPPEGTALSATPVTATGTGDALTALQALEQLKSKALAWQKDARLGLLSNVRPGQQKSLLGTTLGDPNINESTPGGKGRNWTLIAFSPSGKGAMAFSTDGTQVDLVKEGVVTDEVLSRFNAPHLSALNLSDLDGTKLVDSDKLLAQMGERGKSGTIGVALLAPDGLGLGPLPTPAAGGDSPQLAYETFSTDPSKQVFVFADARTGTVLLDSSTP